jgi:oligosaccharide reducing-end xylanase
MSTPRINLRSTLIASTLALSGFSQWCFAQHAQSVYSTGTYRSLFNEYDALGAGGLDQWLINYKAQVNYQYMIYGNGGTGDEDTKLYYEVANTNPKEGYIFDFNDNDIRSEGMSYGMMIAVMMDDQPTFDALWRFAKDRMRQSQGWFAWRIAATQPYSPMDTNPAPDG